MQAAGSALPHLKDPRCLTHTVKVMPQGLMCCAMAGAALLQGGAT